MARSRVSAGAARFEPFDSPATFWVSSCRGCKACIRGTWIPVAVVLGSLADGLSPSEA